MVGNDSINKGAQFRSYPNVRIVPRKVKIARNLADHFKEMIYGIPSENHKDNLIRLTKKNYYTLSVISVSHISVLEKKRME